MTDIPRHDDPMMNAAVMRTTLDGHLMRISGGTIRWENLDPKGRHLALLAALTDLLHVAGLEKFNVTQLVQIGLFETGREVGREEAKAELTKPS